jgi:hypothetical protein
MARIGVAHDERHGGQAVNVECTSRRGTEIDLPTVHEWSAIVDAHRRRPAVAAIDDGHLRAEWQRAVRGCHLAGIHNLAARGLAVAVNRGDAQVSLSPEALSLQAIDASSQDEAKQTASREVPALAPDVRPLTRRRLFRGHVMCSDLP